MSTLSVSLILLAAVVHAVWNILAKGIRGNGTLFVWWYGLVSSVALIPVSLLEPGAWQSWGWPLVGAAVVSGLLHTVYGTALQAGYDRAPLGVVYAVARGTGPMITMIVAVLFLGEQLSLTAAAGAIAVLVGVAVALMSSALPYALELAALRRLPAETFSILVSMAPAVAALVGWLILGQGMGPGEIAGMGLVIVASAAAVRSGRRPSLRPRREPGSRRG